MRIKFITDYRGVLTGERYYQAGEMGDFESPAAARLVNAGRAEYAEDQPTNLELLPLADLRKVAKSEGIKGYSRMKRETLIKRLIDG
jgi:hypothetical protein